MAKNSDNQSETPLMQQYLKVKAKYPDAILLFRVGDFYETFGEDAIKASQVLGIILTSRNNGGSKVELAGFPYHSLDMYLPRLVRAGFRVAICEQLEKPSPLKKIVKRGVTEIVTPGVAVDERLLDTKSNNYLASLAIGKNDMLGLAFLDISTGEFLVSEGDWTTIEKLLQSFHPSEILFAKSKQKSFEQRFGDKFYSFHLDDWVFSLDFAREKLLSHFDVASLKGFGLEEMELGQIAAGAALHYLAATENNNIQHINAIGRIQSDKYVWLDRFTIRNLELLQPQFETGTPLIQILDQTISPMGARLMKKWVALPLTSIAEIEARLEVVGYLLNNESTVEKSEGLIRQMGDLERLISKVPLGKVNPREVAQLRRALEAIEPLRALLTSTGLSYLGKMADSLNSCPVLREIIRTQLVEDPPVNVSKGGVFNPGCHAELDDLRHVISHSKELLLDIQVKEAKRTGIDNLKIGFNSVFGYFLEVTNKYKDKNLIPPDWTRKQTLTNAERYITDELKQLENKILGAEERILELEQSLFDQLVQSLGDYIQPIQHNATWVARLDCLMSFAKVARKHRYTQPELNEGLVIDIKGGRHPVIEQRLELGEDFIPNDVYLDSEEQQLLMITGPNMSGKSALLRQTALICLMAQMGSFVPATLAKIGLVDKVFTRVGASDNISSGESTFMVEMNETATIMNNISDRSLILLDEIGRGTSTYDGISIAWSIAEFLHDNGWARPKTLFATHYHELNELAQQFPRIKNFHVSTKEVDNKVLFLRRLQPGGSQHSFGIHVARMAGMPKTIVERANEILEQLEQKHIGNDDIQESNGLKSRKPKTEQLSRTLQLSIFETADPLAGKLREAILTLDLNGMTPIDCMIKLQEWKKLIEK